MCADILKRGPNQLRKSNIKHYEEKVHSVISEWSGKETSTAMWMSRQLYVDFNLSMDNIEPECVQALLIGENLSPVLLTLYNVEHPLESEITKELEKRNRMRTFSDQFAREMSKHLLDRCGIDFVILPCTIPFEKFSKEEFEREVERQRKNFQGLMKLSERQYQHMAEAAASLAATSYVPYILEKNDQVHIFWHEEYVFLLLRCTHRPTLF